MKFASNNYFRVKFVFQINFEWISFINCIEWNLISSLNFSEIHFHQLFWSKISIQDQFWFKFTLFIILSEIDFKCNAILPTTFEKNYFTPEWKQLFLVKYVSNNYFGIKLESRYNSKFNLDSFTILSEICFQNQYREKLFKIKNFKKKYPTSEWITLSNLILSIPMHKDVFFSFWMYFYIVVYRFTKFLET